MEVNKIYNQDCLSGLMNIETSSIDMVITSPPYEDLRDYDGYLFDFEYFKKLACELYRCLKNGGVIVWIISDKTKNGSESGESFRQSLYMKEIGFKLWDTMIFAKKNPVQKNHRRYEQYFEYMFVYSKGTPKTFNPILIPCKYNGKVRTGTYRHSKNGELNKLNTEGKVKSQKIKGNIWYYTTGRRCTKTKLAHKHQAIFPDKLVEDHLESWTNKGDLILDPFMGSGTVAKVCKNMDRNYIGFEISKNYCELAKLILDKI